jgi:ParB-like chromosome segregation protein Spo0J
MPERAAMSQLSFTSFSTMRIADIMVGTRHRRDLGDIEGLAGSIADIGLLHPIVIRRDGMLIAGERRLEACKQLGWVDVPVNVVDIAELVRAELHENSIRKDFLPSEIDAIRRALEPIEKADAEGRMKAGTPAKVSQGSGRVTDKIGSFAGVSGRTVEKIAAVVAAAEAEPEKFGHLVEEMDKSGKVDRAHKQLKIKPPTAKPAATPEQTAADDELPLSAPPASSAADPAELGTTKKPKVKPEPYRNEWIDWTNAVRHLSALPACGLDVLASREPDQIEQLRQDCAAALTNLNHWHRRLEKSHGGSEAANDAA